MFEILFLLCSKFALINKFIQVQTYHLNLMSSIFLRKQGTKKEFNYRSAKYAGRNEPSWPITAT